MTLGNLVARTSRGVVLGAAVFAAVGLVSMPRPAHAIGPGAAVGLGLGAFALGSALGAAPYYNPYYNPYGYYGPPPGYYYGPRRYYYPRGRCWSPYYHRYYPC